MPYNYCARRRPACVRRCACSRRRGALPSLAEAIQALLALVKRSPWQRLSGFSPGSSCLHPARRAASAMKLMTGVKMGEEGAQRTSRRLKCLKPAAGATLKYGCRWKEAGRRSLMRFSADLRLHGSRKLIHRAAYNNLDCAAVFLDGARTPAPREKSRSLIELRCTNDWRESWREDDPGDDMPKGSPSDRANESHRRAYYLRRADRGSHL